MLTSLLEVQLQQSGTDAVGMVAAADARLVELLKVSQPEAGLQLALAEGVTALEFDRARLTRIVVDAYTAFMAAGPELAQLAATEPELIQDFVDVQVGAFNSSWNAMHAVQNAHTVRQATEALLDVNVTLLEAPGGLLRADTSAGHRPQAQLLRQAEGRQRHRAPPHSAAHGPPTAGPSAAGDHVDDDHRA
jgi:hypothetical protein